MSLVIKKENLRELRDIVEKSLGAREVLVITNGGDGDIVEQALEKIKKQIFRKDGEVEIIAHEEVTRRGQWLGLLDAYKSWKSRKGAFKEGGVSIGGMYPGKGTRLSPVTQRLHGIKPFFPMLIRCRENSDWLTGAAASLYTSNHLAYHLDRMGFCGMLWKWGDEPQIPATRLMDLDRGLSDVDFIRFGSRQAITENLAENKEWLKADKDGDLIAQVRRRPRKDLLKRLEVEDTPDAAGMVHIGSPAFSYLLLEEAVKIFGDWDGWVDVDGYLCDALTLGESAWKEELKVISKQSDLQYLLKTHPDFYSACQKLKANISAKRGGRPLKIKVIDFGEDLYWGDIGQLAKARDSLHKVAENTTEGEFAKELAAIEHIKPDEFGNIVVGDCIYPKNGNVTKSVLIDARLYGESKVNNSVLIQSDLGNAEIKERSVVYQSTALNLKMAGRGFSFRSIGEDLKIDEDGVHTSIPADLHDIGKGFEDWRADSTKDVGSKKNYYQVRFGNPRSFDQEREVMRQREIPPAEIETEIDLRLRKPLIERMRGW